MSARDFERPGAVTRREPEEWPYHAPTPEEGLANIPHEAEAVEAVVVLTNDDRPRRAHARPWVVVLVACLVGALMGGGVVVALMRPEPSAASIPITLETFPREFMGSDRNDLSLREAGFGPTVERLDGEFEDQLAAFRFAYKGRGATFGYGPRLTLTIVDGIIAPLIPREGELDLGGRVRETRRIISLSTPTVSCTFEPQPVLNPDRGVEEFGEFSGIGYTDCVLVDRDRNLSLRLAHSPTTRGSDAEETAATFSVALEDLHATLIS